MKKIFNYFFVFLILYILLTNPVLADSGWDSIIEIGGEGAGAGAAGGGATIGDVLVGLLSLVVASIVFYIGIVKRSKERKKKNVQDRNFDGTHAELDKEHAGDKEMIEFIDATEDITDEIFADFFNNINNLEYVKNNSSPEYYERVKQFIDTNEQIGNHLVVKDTVVITNEIKEKHDNRFVSFIIFECYNYMADKDGNYICGYKTSKEFVRKKIVYEIVDKHLVIIAIDDL